MPSLHAASAAVSPELHLRFADGVPVLVLPDESAFASQEFEILRAWFRERMPEHVPAIQGRNVRLDLGRRDIKLFDLRRLVHLVKQEFALDVTGLYLRPAAVHRFAERELKLKLFTDEDATPAPEDEVTEETSPAASTGSAALLAAAPLPHDLLPEDLDGSDIPAGVTLVPADVTPRVATAPPLDEGRRTQIVHRTLRSGAVVRFDGDVFVFGDVNPGAQVTATGNIVVLGALKGLAQAGSGGDESTFIFAFDLRPTQLRIGPKIAVPAERRAPPEIRPEMATVVEDRISIDPYGPGKAPPAPSGARLRFWS
jgi:septum site-determining protein MinC